jgi:hypothetical protein
MILMLSQMLRGASLYYNCGENVGKRLIQEDEFTNFPHKQREADGPCLAVAVGFEPTERFHAHTLSRRAP